LPLALAFSVASGVDPQAGIYTAIVAGIIASLFGGSRFQITGPTGAMSVILVDIVREYGLEKVWIACLMAGIMQVLLSVFKLGNLVKYIPFPVITGFTNGIAVLIFCNQITNFLGIDHANQGLFEEVYFSATHLHQTNLSALSLGLGAILIQILWPKINKSIPASLLSLLVCSGVAVLFSLNTPTIGSIPRELPHFQWLTGWNDFDLIRHLMPAAFSLAALGSIESLLSAMVADSMTVSDKHDSNKELFGQGLANIIVPFFGGIPATGAIARTAVNIRSGAKSKMAGVFHSLFLLLMIFIFAPYASKIPLSVLAGILMVISFNMLEWEEVRVLLKTTRSDVSVMFTTWFVTVFFDLVLAIEVGLIAAGVLFIKKMSELSLTKMPDEKVFLPGTELDLGKHIVVYRVDGPLFFGVTERFVNVLHEIPDVKALILRMRYVPTIDATGLAALEEIHEDLKKRNCKLVLTGVRPSLMKLMKHSELTNIIGEDNIFSTTRQAVNKIKEELKI
jgi:SulP family sulfate permease